MSAAITLRVGILGVGSIGQTIGRAIDGRDFVVQDDYLGTQSL